MPSGNWGDGGGASRDEAFLATREGIHAGKLARRPRFRKGGGTEQGRAGAGEIEGAADKKTARRVSPGGLVN
jgi:hypothetical protein